MKHPLSEKLSIVRLLLEGYPLKRLCSERHLHRSMVYQWRLVYELRGEAGLARNYRNCGTTAAEKEFIVREFLENSVPLSRLCLVHDLSRSAIKSWVTRVRREGYDCLYTSTDKDYTSDKPMGRPKKREPQTELEKLQYENLVLRAENALLKKLKTLVEEREARARQTGRRSSTD